MHLFVLEYFTNLDNLAPIIYKLASKNQKVYVCGTHPIKSFKNDKLISYLKKNNNVYYGDLRPVKIKDKITIFFISFLSLLPKKIICGRSFWDRISKKMNLIDIDNMLKLIHEKKICSITIEDSLNKEKQKKIKEISTITNIPLVICFPSSFTHIYNKNTFNQFSVSISDFNIISNKLVKFGNANDKKNYFFGMARYNLEWFRVLKNIYYQTEIKSNKNLIKILALSHSTQKNYKKFKILIDKIKTFNNVEIIEKQKPKDNYPIKCKSSEVDLYNSSQLVDWCDIVIFNTETSIFIEALMKNKKIIYMKYLDDFDDRTLDSSYLNQKDIYIKMENDDELIKYLDKLSLKVTKLETSNNLLKSINEITSNNFENLEKFSEFYNRLYTNK